MRSSLQILTNPEKFSEQERIYIELRKKEGRIYSDEEVKKLPGIAPNHPHVFEWKIRKRSSERLIKYLCLKARHLHILEIGCGNGWLSHRMAEVNGAEVTGLDINMTELEQAARVFSHLENLHFVYADILDSSAIDKKFDIIVIAAAIQYFAEPVKLIDRLLELTNPGGEIHILDSPIYKREEKSIEAKARSSSYFLQQEAPTMNRYYFHHDNSLFNKYSFQRVNPSFIDRIVRRYPFPWVIIYKS